MLQLADSCLEGINASMQQTQGGNSFDSPVRSMLRLYPYKFQTMGDSKLEYLVFNTWCSFAESNSDIKLECAHGTQVPPLMQNLHILTKPKMIYFDEQRAINLEGMVRY